MMVTQSGVVLAAFVSLAGVAGCGGSQSESGGRMPGSSSSGDPMMAEAEGQIDGGLPADAAPPPAPVTFVLHNEAEENLVLNMDRGYQPVILAYSGKPPNAQSILMFPTHCTASCEAPAEEVCPVCEEPEKVKEIQAAEQRIVIAPGESHEVPWDGQVFRYEKTKGVNEKGRAKRCKCWHLEEAAAETYTVKACALRLTQTAEQSSRLQCVDGSMSLPSEEPIRVELAFPPM